MKHLLFIIISMIVPLSAISSPKGHKLQGKTINVIGDSYVYNHKQPKELTWHYKLAEKYHMIYRNYGKNGNGLVTPEGSGTPVIDRLNDVSNEADYIVLIGGKNDYNKQIAIDKFKVGLRKICQDVLKKYPGKKICLFTPWRVYAKSTDDPKQIKLSTYADTMEEVGKECGIPVFNASKDGTVKMFDPAFREKYCQGPSDVSHLNEEGHKLFLKKAEKFLLKL